MIDAFLQEIQLVDKPGGVHLTRMALRVGPDGLAEFLLRMGELFEEYTRREPDPDSQPMSVFFAVHPDVGRGP